MIQLRALILTILICASCSTSNYITKSNIESIDFGEGGGFTGNFESCALTVRGELTCTNGLVSTLKRKSIYDIISMADSIHCLPFNSPGNYSYHIRINRKTDTTFYAWSIEQSQYQEVIELYKLLQQKKTDENN